MNYDHLFALANEAFESECHARFAVKEDYSNVIFPRIETATVDGQKTYTLLFNRKIEAVLSLFNAAFVFGFDSTELIAQYLMALESIDADEYDYAEAFLNVLRESIADSQLEQTFKERSRDIKVVTAMQVLYILFHEISHEVDTNNPSRVEMGLKGSKVIVEEMLEEVKQNFTEEGVAGMSKNEYLRELCKSYMPDGYSDEDLDDFVQQYLANEALQQQSMDYLEDLLNGSDDPFLTEMMCDRNAFKYMMLWLVPSNKYKTEVTGLLLMVYMALLAMDYTAVFQSYSRVIEDIEDRMHIQQKSVLRNRNMLNSIKIYVNGLNDETRDGLNDIENTISQMIVEFARLAHEDYGEVIEDIRENREQQKDVQIRKVIALNKEVDSVMSGVLEALQGDIPELFNKLSTSKMRGHWLIKGLQKIGYGIIAAKLFCRKLRK